MLNLALLIPLVAVIDGVLAEACEYPSTAAFGHCSGVLVHPQVVLTAAHCFLEPIDNVKISFGQRLDSPVFSAVADYCVPYPHFDEFGEGTDWAYCWLDEPVTSIPVTPVANAKDLASLGPTRDRKTSVVGVGFGRDEDNKSGVKRAAHLWLADTQNGEVMLAPAGVGLLSHGDSGGPIYTQFPDGGWRVIGTTSYGTGYLDWEAATSTLQAVDWVLQDTGVDLLDYNDVPEYLEADRTREGCGELPTVERQNAASGVPETGWYAFPTEEDEPTLETNGCNAAPKSGFFGTALLFTLLMTRRRR